MYHPISVNVIRQSLKLSGIPKPLYTITLDQVRFPTDTIVTAYRFFWRIEAVEAYLAPIVELDKQYSYSAFIFALRDCFCQDIFPTDWDYDDKRHQLYVTICTRFVQHNWE